MALDQLGDALAALAIHAAAGGVLQAGGKHQHPGAGGAYLAVEILGKNAALIHRHAMQRQPELACGGLDAGRGEGFGKHRIPRLAERQQRRRHTLLGTGAERYLGRRRMHAALLQPLADSHPATLLELGRRIGLQGIEATIGNQALQGARQVIAAAIMHRHVGRQVDAIGRQPWLLEVKQAGLVAIGQHVGAAPDLAGHQVPARRLAIRLHHRARVDAQGPGQAPLRRQPFTGLELALANGAGNRFDQRQIGGQLTAVKVR